MRSNPVSPGYRRKRPARRSKLGPHTGAIDRILEEDLSVPKKQGPTAKGIFELLREEHGLKSGYIIVKDYAHRHRSCRREIFFLLTHPSGHAAC